MILWDMVVVRDTGIIICIRLRFGYMDYAAGHKPYRSSRAVARRCGRRAMLLGSRRAAEGGGV